MNAHPAPLRTLVPRLDERYLRRAAEVQALAGDLRAVMGQALYPAPLELDTAVRAQLEADVPRLVAGLRAGVTELVERHGLEQACRLLGLGPAETGWVSRVWQPQELVCARVDLLLAADGWRVLEINVGGGMADAELGDASRLLAPLWREAAGCDLVPVDDALSGYSEAILGFGQDLAGAATPRVAVVDWWSYFDECLPFLARVATSLRSAGAWAGIGHLPDLSWDGDRLRLRGEEVDLVYANFLLEDVHEFPGHVEPLAHAVAAGAARIVMGGLGDLMSTKAALAVLHERAAGPEEALVRRYVPPTARVTDGGMRWDGEPVEARDLLDARQRHRLVLKPSIGSAGRDVAIGPATDGPAWEAAVRRALAEPGAWVVQEFVPASHVVLPSATASGVDTRMGCQLSVFVCGERVLGFGARLLEDGRGLMYRVACGACLVGFVSPVP